MKFSAALFLASSFFVGSVHGLSLDTFALGVPTIEKVDSDTMQVVFTHGEGADPTPGATVQVISQGDCEAMGAWGSSDFVTNGAIDNKYDVTDISGTAAPYTTTYTFDIDVGSNLLDVTNDGTEDAKLKLCVTHYFQADSDVVPNFQQTLLTITYDLEAGISSFTFLTAASDPDSQSASITIDAEISDCRASSVSPVNQGEILCLEVCPVISDSSDSSSTANDFYVSALLDVQAAFVVSTDYPNPPSVSQSLTNNLGEETVDEVVDLTEETGTASNCIQVEFFLDSEFFIKYQTSVTNQAQTVNNPFPTVQVTGTAQLADFNPTARRRNSRALQTQQTNAEFEMEITLAKPEGTSGTVSVTVTRFALVGAAGAALLI